MPASGLQYRRSWEPFAATLPFAAVLAALMACTPVARRAQPVRLDFLENPRVTRQQVLEALGEPSGRFEDGDVFTYRLRQNDAGYAVVPPAVGASNGWRNVHYSLVLAFDEAGVLTEQRRIVIHGPDAGR